MRPVPTFTQLTSDRAGTGSVSFASHLGQILNGADAPTPPDHPPALASLAALPKAVPSSNLAALEAQLNYLSSLKAAPISVPSLTQATSAAVPKPVPSSNLAALEAQLNALPLSTQATPEPASATPAAELPSLSSTIAAQEATTQPAAAPFADMLHSNLSSFSGPPAPPPPLAHAEPAPTPPTDNVMDRLHAQLSDIAHAPQDASQEAQPPAEASGPASLPALSAPATTAATEIQDLFESWLQAPTTAEGDVGPAEQAGAPGLPYWEEIRQLIATRKKPTAQAASKKGWAKQRNRSQGNKRQHPWERSYELLRDESFIGKTGAHRGVCALGLAVRTDARHTQALVLCMRRASRLVSATEEMFVLQTIAPTPPVLQRVMDLMESVHTRPLAPPPLVEQVYVSTPAASDMRTSAAPMSLYTDPAYVVVCTCKRL